MKLPRKVYAIQHNITKRIYIGSSGDLKKRYLSHLYKLRAGCHDIRDMQDDFDKYGEDYSVFILDEIQCIGECRKEYDWMEKYSTHIRGIGYNYKDPALVGRYNAKKDIPIKEGLPEPLV